jgi:hypothetical protein
MGTLPMDARIASLLAIASFALLVINCLKPSIAATSFPRTRPVIYVLMLAASVFLLFWSVSYFMHF